MIRPKQAARCWGARRSATKASDMLREDMAPLTACKEQACGIGANAELGEAKGYTVKLCMALFGSGQPKNSMAQPE